MYFVLEFKLIDAKELVPLQTLIDSMMGQDKAKLIAPGSVAAASGAPAAVASSPTAASPSGADDDEVVRSN
jgi:ribosomal protein L12E/L44/L45/RPP1/RPP2